MMRWGYILLALLGLSSDALAQGTTLSNLSAGTAVTSSDLFYDVQTVGIGGVKVTGGQLVTFMNGALISGATSTIQFNNNGGFGGFGTWDGTNLTVPSVIVSGFSTQGMVCNSSAGLLSTSATLCANVGATGTGNIVRSSTPTISSATLTLATITSPTITGSPTISGVVTFAPSTDNTGSIGTSTARWTSIYGVTYYASASVVGVTCAAGSTSAATLTVTNGIVTHC